MENTINVTVTGDNTPDIQGMLFGYAEHHPPVVQPEHLMGEDKEEDDMLSVAIRAIKNCF